MGASVLTKESMKLNINEFLQKGCNERTYLNSDGFLKYGISIHDPHLVNRGSCTCSTVTDCNYESISNAYEAYKRASNYSDLIRKRSRSLKNLLGMQERGKNMIFYAPSGTDLSYYPGIFIKVLNPGKPILNVITSADEVGGGTDIAAQGIYHGAYNQFDEEVPKGNKISGGTKIKVHGIDLRAQNGTLACPIDDLEVIVTNYVENHAIVVNLTHCSKSGVEDYLEVMDAPWADKVMWNVDMCQFRYDENVIKALLEKNASVMLTGSKFYQSPPFCGALIVPSMMYDKLVDADWSKVKMYKSVFSIYDIPAELRMKVDFNREFNPALHARWQCAIDEMARFKALDKQKVKEKVNLWHEKMTNIIHKTDEFELMPGGERSNKTIISFRVKANGRYLNLDELKKFHYNFTTKDYSAEYGQKHVFIGQPVKYGKNQGFIRLAIGSKNIREFVTKDEYVFENDMMVMHMLQKELNLAYAYVE